MRSCVPYSRDAHHRITKNPNTPQHPNTTLQELDFFRQHPSYKDLRNVGTAFLSTNLSDHLISAIRRQMPTIQHHITRNINDLQKDLDSMGGTVDNTRGGMIHAVLTQARTFETCFKKALEGQRAGVCVGGGLDMCG